MKKAIIFLVIFCFAFSVLFIGCGKKEEPKPTPVKVIKATPKPVAPAPKIVPKPDADSKVGGMQNAPPKKKAGGLKKTN